ncbi:MAG: TonB-dependent receptor [Ferruginibacter sp.]
MKKYTTSFLKSYFSFASPVFQMKIFLSLIFLLSVAFCVKGQNEIQIKGLITDDKGAPLQGASILLKGINKGTNTNSTGSYLLNVPSGKVTLIFSFTGFQNKEIAIGSNTTINVSLTPENKTLTDVVVTGYSRQSKRDVTGAVSTISTDVISKTPVIDVGAVLQGRVAGVSVDAQGGPGNTAAVRIRGFGTIGDNDPLYVIDGVQMRGSNNLLNNADIETLTVLKDPSLTSLYGAQGGNGVIVITTKSGRNGTPKLEYSSSVSFQSPTNTPDFISPQQFADAYWGYLKNSGLPQSDLFYGSGTSPVLPDYIIERQSGTPLVVKDGDPAANPALYNLNTYRIIKTNKQGTNWFNEVIKPSVSQTHQLTLSGATDKSNYALTFNFLDDKGIVLNTFFRRYSIRVNTEFRPVAWLKVGENMQFSYSEGSEVENHTPRGLLAELYQDSRLLPIYDIAGNFTGPKGIQASVGFSPGGNNPILSQKNNKNNKGFNSGIIGSAYIDVEPIKGLVFESKLGVQLYPYQFHYFQDTFPQNNFQSPYNSFTEGGGYLSDWRWTNKLSYDIRINEIHKISAFVAYEARRFVSRTNSGTTPNLPYTSPSYLYLSNGVPIPANSLYNALGGGGDEASSLSYFGNVNYIFMDKYLLSGVLRRDGSSKFGTANRYGTFPSVSVGWRVSQEHFMDNIKCLTDLKLRAAYGTNGNDAIPSGLAFNQYSANTFVSSYDLGGANSAALTGVGLYQIGNAFLQWETNKTTNLGFDAGLLKNSLTISFSWFNRITDKLLFNPAVTGLQGDALAPYKNVMKFSNKGFELELGYVPKRTRNFGYDMNFNIATYRNKVLTINGGTNDFVRGAGYADAQLDLTRSVVGMPVSSFYGYIVEGIFQSNAEYVQNAVAHPGLSDTTAAGNFKFKDISGPGGKPDGKINNDDRTFIGNPHPKFTYGYNLNLYYKNFDLNVFIQGVSGNKIFNYWRTRSQWPGTFGKDALDTWSPSNTDAKLPMWSVIGYGTNDVPSSFLVENGSYLRIKNIQLGYNFPKMRGISRLRLYVQVFNIATFTNYSGIDPEISTGSPGAAGVDFGGNYPITRKILVGVNLGL